MECEACFTGERAGCLQWHYRPALARRPATCHDGGIFDGGRQEMRRTCGKLPGPANARRKCRDAAVCDVRPKLQRDAKQPGWPIGSRCGERRMAEPGGTALRV